MFPFLLFNNEKVALIHAINKEFSETDLYNLYQLLLRIIIVEKI